MQKGFYLILGILFFTQAPPSLADSAELSAGTKQNTESKVEDVEPNLWPKPLNDGANTVFYFAEAVGGKTLKQDTFQLLKGVTDVIIEKDNIIFKRSDNEELKLGYDTDHGGKFLSDWQKAKNNLEAKFGQAGKDFLDNIEGLHLEGDRIEIRRKGPELLSIDMGERKLHHAFDLRGIRFGKLSMNVDSSGNIPALKNIDGARVIINAPGFSFPVEVKEFAKKRLEKDNDIKVGVKNPVPSALRTFLFMPSLLRFHFVLPRKD